MFLEHKTRGENGEELSAAEISKLKGKHIKPKHLVPLTLYLKFSVHDKLLNQDVLNRIFRAFNIDLIDHP